MKLEEQIEKLAEIGLPLNDGITIDDFFLSWPRTEYEKSPFDLLLFSYGTEVEEEPFGRFFCDRAWNFDAECIEYHGDYVTIVKQFHRISGNKKPLEDLSDHVDLVKGQARLNYTIGETRRELEVLVNNDWADPETVQIIMDDMQDEGFKFVGKANGQATVWFYVTSDNAPSLKSLINNADYLDKPPWWKFW